MLRISVSRLIHLSGALGWLAGVTRIVVLGFGGVTGVRLGVNTISSGKRIAVVSGSELYCLMRGADGNTVNVQAVSGALLRRFVRCVRGCPGTATSRTHRTLSKGDGLSGFRCNCTSALIAVTGVATSNDVAGVGVTPAGKRYLGRYFRVVFCNTPKAKGSRGVGRVLRSGRIRGSGVFEAAFRPSDSCSAFINTCGPAVRGRNSELCDGRRLVDGLARVGSDNLACSPRGFKTGC